PLVSIASFGTPHQYIMHAGNLGYVRRPRDDEDRINATFEIVPGLANGDFISLRSVNCPKHYLVHGDFRLRLQKYEESVEYRRNGTFKQIDGLAGSGTVSFESINYPGYYIHQRESNLFVDKNNGSAKFKTEATFVIGEPQFKLWEK